MKIAVLGGLGIQGKAALADLSNSKIVNEIICAEAHLDEWENISRWIEVTEDVKYEFSQNEKKRQH